MHPHAQVHEQLERKQEELEDLTFELASLSRDHASSLIHEGLGLDDIASSQAHYEVSGT